MHLIQAPNPPLLTARQVQILAGIARGRSNTDVAADLYLAVGSVHAHVRRIGLRLGTRSRAGIVGEGYRTGYLASLTPEPRPPFLGLTTRLLQVLDGMARGLTDAEIGAELGIGEPTIGTHAQRLYRCLDANCRAHAVALGYQHRLLTTTPLQDAA